MKLVEAKNITEDKIILDDISFSLHKGEALAIEGDAQTKRLKANLMYLNSSDLSIIHYTLKEVVLLVLFIF